MTEQEEKVWRAVQEMNCAWAVEANADKLRKFFHEKMVAITPVDHFRREGREACVEGWIGFAKSNRILEWEEFEPLIQMYCNNTAAIVTYHYRIALDSNGKTMELRGRDMLTLVYEDNRWQLVADQFSPFPVK
jgi:hypothetical protein